jgi:putative oxidoreductase
MSFGLLILRLVVGLTLAAHGSQKLFGWFGGYSIAGTGEFFEQLGFRPGRVYAFLAGMGEFIGGLLLAAGFLTPVAAVLLTAVMLVAAIAVHLKNGFFIQNVGFEYNLVLGAAALVASFTGPGEFSIDQALGISLSGEVWGFSALILGLLGGALPLLARRPALPTAPAAVGESR